MRKLFLFLLTMSFCTTAIAVGDRGLAAWEAGDFTTAFKEWKPYADKGNSGAQYSIGLLYRDGKGVQKDDKEALAFFQKAAEQGHADAQLLVGTYYAAGRIVAHDDKKSAFWFRKAAEQGLVKAQYLLAGYYINGMGVPQNDAEGAAWYRKAAEQGDVPSETALGQMYASGRGLDRDFQQAAMWYRKAAEQGNADAQYALAYRLQLGGLGDLVIPKVNDVPRDYEQAIFWLRKASAQKHAGAQLQMGIAYSNGWGVQVSKVVGLALADLANVPLNETPWRDTLTRKNRIAEMTAKEIEAAAKLTQEMAKGRVLEEIDKYITQVWQTGIHQ